MNQTANVVTPAVLDACRRGDRDAFRLVYDAHKDAVYSMALYFFRGDDATAADVTQQVFLKLMDKIGHFKGHSEFSTWLHRLVVNACVDRTRGRWGRARMAAPDTLETLPAVSSQESDLERREIAAEVQSALAELSPKIRMAIVLRYFEDLSYADMAAALNCSIGTVASRLNRGHELLARRLGTALRRGGA